MSIRKKEITEEERRRPSVDTKIKVTTCGDIIEVMEAEKVNRNHGKYIMRFDGGAYCHVKDFDASTGEVTGEMKFFKKSDKRADNKNSLAKSMKKARELINCNVQRDTIQNTRWVTLTYAENMTDTERLTKDRENFWRSMLRWHDKQNLPRPEFITIVEPQGRGAWHLHELWIYPTKAPYIPNEVVAKRWKRGWVTIKQLEDTDNVGAYVTAYLCDVPLDEAEQSGIDPAKYEILEKEVTDETGKTVTKRFLKGARVKMYPAGMDFYRHSRGVNVPVVEWLSIEQTMKKIGAATPTFQKNVRLLDDEKGYSNDLHYAYYNLARTNGQEKKA